MKYIAWEDPYPGLDKDGGPVTCIRRIYMTEDDVLNMYRGTHKRLDLTDDELLHDIIITNWADRIDVDRLP